MNDILTWGSLIVASGSIVAAIKFWMDMGEIKQKASQALSTAGKAAADLAAFKDVASREFATIGALTDAERRLVAAVEGIRTDFRSVAERFDRFLLEVVRKE